LERPPLIKSNDQELTRKLGKRAHSPEDQSASEVNKSKPVAWFHCPTST